MRGELEARRESVMSWKEGRGHREFFRMIGASALHTQRKKKEKSDAVISSIPLCCGSPSLRRQEEC